MTTLLQPTLHKPVPLGTRVRVVGLSEAHPSITGEVAGIASCHVIFIYIILLDTPIVDGYGAHRAIPCSGTMLEGLDGTTWKL